MTKVSVIIPAAGAGRRFGTAGNKIHQTLAGEPIFLRTLEVFAGRADVVQILLVVAPEEQASIGREFADRLEKMGVALVAGGNRRSESVRNALAAVCAEAELVCVHDAVRPCVAQAWIEAVFAEAARSGAAILAYPVHGTLKKVTDERTGLIDATVTRVHLWQAQTPQVFRRAILQAAYQADLSEATDDAQLVEAAGHPVRVVMGDPRNLKITTPSDLVLAEAIWASMNG